MFLSTASPEFSLPRGGMVALRGKVGSVCEEFEDNEGGASIFLKSSCAGLPGLSWIKDH